MGSQQRRKWCSVVFFPPVKGLLGSLLNFENDAVAVRGVMSVPAKECSCSDMEILICYNSL